MFALNQGEVCTCPSRALIQESIYDKFLADATERTKKVTQGNPLDTDTMIGAQASNDQLEKILSYIQIGKDEGARLVCGGERADLGGDLSEGYYVTPTIFEGKNSMRIFQEEIFGPVVSVTSFTDFDDAMHIANDTLYGLGAGVWSRDINTAYRAGRTIQAGRVWTNCYHAYPAHAAFGGYKGPASGVRPTLRCSSTTSRPRTCWSATPPRSSASSKCRVASTSPTRRRTCSAASSATTDR
jgi:aldehyde dehydrogenase